MHAVEDDPCHNPLVAKSAVWNEDKAELKETVTACDMQCPDGFWDGLECEMIEAATGIKMTQEEMNLTAKRGKNLFRAILIRNHNRTREMEVNEVYPALTFPDCEGTTIEWDDYNYLVDLYYDERGWDRKTGWPTRATYEKTGLGDIADELEKLGKLPM
jgi:aldehyde:ferredoxin oxidoreductase